MLTTTTESTTFDWVGKPRPTRNHKQVETVAAERLLPNVLAWLKSNGESDMDEETKAETLEQLVENFDDDGYMFAVRLDRDGWSPDSELVEILSGGSLWQAEEKCVREWMKQNGIAPKLAVGDKVTIPAEWAKRKGHEVSAPFIGEVANVRDNGTYTVFCEALGHVREGMGTHGYVEPWDKIEAFPKA